MSQLVKNHDGTLSKTKVGVWIAGIGLALLQFGQYADANDLFHTPELVVMVIKAIIAIAGSIAGVGARDAITKVAGSAVSVSLNAIEPGPSRTGVHYLTEEREKAIGERLKSEGKGTY